MEDVLADKVHDDVKRKIWDAISNNYYSLETKQKLAEYYKALTTDSASEISVKVTALCQMVHDVKSTEVNTMIFSVSKYSAVIGIASLMTNYLVKRWAPGYTGLCDLTAYVGCMSLSITLLTIFLGLYPNK